MKQGEIKVRTNKLENILLAHSCCSFTNTNNTICELCPYYNSEECEEANFSEAAMINVIKKYKRNKRRNYEKGKFR